MLGILFDGLGTGDGGYRIFQFGGRVGGATGLAVVAVLVLGAALGAGTLDKAVRQKHLFFRVVGLGNSALDDVSAVTQSLVNGGRQLAVLGAVGAVVVVKGDGEVGKIGLMLAGDAGDQLLGLDPLVLRAQHDGGAVGVIGADIQTIVAAHFLEPHPDIGLYVLDQVSQVDRAIGVGQGTGNQYGSFLL